MKRKTQLIVFLVTWSVCNLKSQQTSPNNNNFKYFHCLKEVYFSGTSDVNYLEIKRDDGSGPYLAPHFIKTYPGGGCLSSVGVIQEKKPVGYVSGTKARLKAIFYTDCPHPFYLRGKGPEEILFPSQLVIPFNGEVIYDFIDATQSFEIGVVRYFEKFVISWQLSEDGVSGWVDIDESENELYVTYNSPIAEIPGIDYDGTLFKEGIGYEWFESLFYIGCKNANGKNEKISITSAIWNEFTDNEVSTRNGDRLFYYYRWEMPHQSTTTAYLLKYQDAQCYSWCSFFIDLLKIQGIDQEGDLVLLTSSNDEIPYYMIKNWKFIDNPLLFSQMPSLCDEDEFTHVNIANTEPDLWVSNFGDYYFYDFYYQELIDEDGVIGQSVNNPESWFWRHCIVYLDFINKYFDPSYGKSFFSIDEWVTHSLEAWGCESIIFEELFQIYDPNNELLDDYDFTGDGDLDDSVLMLRFTKNLNASSITTEIHNR
jgi:hypothetical protein